MRAKTQFSTGIVGQWRTPRSWTSWFPSPPGLTRAALDAASRMGAGLNPTIRLIRVQVVPYPLPPTSRRSILNS